jgi:hypothetical protein
MLIVRRVNNGKQYGKLLHSLRAAAPHLVLERVMDLTG